MFSPAEVWASQALVTEQKKPFSPLSTITVQFVGHTLWHEKFKMSFANEKINKSWPIHKDLQQWGLPVNPIMVLAMG